MQRVVRCGSGGLAHDEGVFRKKERIGFRGRIETVLGECPQPINQRPDVNVSRIDEGYVRRRRKDNDVGDGGQILDRSKRIGLS